MNLPTPPQDTFPGIRLGVFDEFLDRVGLEVFLHAQADRGVLHDGEDHEIVGFIGYVLHEDRLQDDVGDAESADGVSIRLRGREFGPAESAARSGLVIDHEGLVEILFQVRLHGPGGNIHFPAGVEGIHDR